MISRSTNIRSALRSKQRGYLLNPYRFDDGESGGPTSGYAYAVMQDEPVLFWRFDDAAGTVCTDVSGNNHHGTYTHPVDVQTHLFTGPTEFEQTLGPQYATTGIIRDVDTRIGVGNALRFPLKDETYGTNIMRGVNGTSPIDLRNAWSCEFSIEPGIWAIYNSTHYLVQFGMPNVTDLGNGSYGAPERALALQVRANGSNNKIFGIERDDGYAGYDTGKWENSTAYATQGWPMHCVMTHNPGVGIYLYVNGNLIVTAADFIINNHTEFRVGYHKSTVEGIDYIGSPFSGKFDDFSLYDKVLSLARIQEHCLQASLRD